MNKKRSLIGLLVGVYACMLSASDLPSVSIESASAQSGGLRLYINATEGGDISDRRLSDLQDYFKKSQCNIQTIEAGHKSAEESAADIVFMPLEQEIAKPFQKIFNLSVVDDQPLSASLLVRSSTGIRDIAELAGVRIAFLSPDSVTGFQLQKTLLDGAGVALKEELVTFTHSHLGAMSLLLHKDVFAAGVATPLAKKWAKANGLTIVAESPQVTAGGIWMKKAFAQEEVVHCENAFQHLFENNRDRRIKNLVKIFPVWIKGLKPIVE